MIKVLLFDLSRTLLFPRDPSYKGELNPLHAQLNKTPGYDFNRHFYLNSELLEFLMGLKPRFRLCIFTSGVIQNAKAIKSRLRKVFDTIFSAEELRVTKKNPCSYVLIAKILHVQLSEILYFDDSQVNVRAALQAGLQGSRYRTNSEVIAHISGPLSSQR